MTADEENRLKGRKVRRSDKKEEKYNSSPCIMGSYRHDLVESSHALWLLFDSRPLGGHGCKAFNDYFTC